MGKHGEVQSIAFYHPLAGEVVAGDGNSKAGRVAWGSGGRWRRSAGIIDSDAGCGIRPQRIPRPIAGCDGEGYPLLAFSGFVSTGSDRDIGVGIASKNLYCASCGERWQGGIVIGGCVATHLITHADGFGGGVV